MLSMAIDKLKNSTEVCVHHNDIPFQDPKPVC